MQGGGGSGACWAQQALRLKQPSACHLRSSLKLHTLQSLQLVMSDIVYSQQNYSTCTTVHVAGVVAHSTSCWHRALLAGMQFWAWLIHSHKNAYYIRAGTVGSPTPPVLFSAPTIVPSPRFFSIKCLCMSLLGFSTSSAQVLGVCSQKQETEQSGQRIKGVGL